MDDLYDKIKEDTQFRKVGAEKAASGIELPQVYRMYQKKTTSQKNHNLINN
jgi:hypothetical protein